jgi:hypothetical protein
MNENLNLKGSSVRGIPSFSGQSWGKLSSPLRQVPPDTALEQVDQNFIN